MCLRNNFPSVWRLKISTIKLHDGQAFSLTEFAYLYVKLGPMNLMTTTHAIYLLPCFSTAVPWMIPLQLPGPGLFSSKLHYSISAKAFFLNCRLKSAEPCITNTFLHFSKQQIKQMTLPTHCWYHVAPPKNAGISEINRLVHSYADSQQNLWFWSVVSTRNRKWAIAMAVRKLFWEMTWM